MMARVIERRVLAEVAAGEPLAAPHEQRGTLVALAALLERSAASAASGSPTGTRLVGARGEEVEVPGAVLQLLRQVVPQLARGRAVSIVPHGEELTTQQAADLLNVSRPFLIGLLEAGEIPFAKTGRHRRIRFGDVAAYKRQRDASRRRHLAKLTELSQDYGLDKFND